jgi:23S rRNA pseudouridine2605 synthase
VKVNKKWIQPSVYHGAVKREQTPRRIGLARALSKLGYCSRSQAAALISAGRVRLNGNVRHNPETPVSLGRDRIAVDDGPIKRAKKVYLMMNKPRGLVTTTSDEKGRATVYAVLNQAARSNSARSSELSSENYASSAEAIPWVAPVGRLDKASEGLLLLTNDSEWGARVAAPETHLHKTYHVQVGTIADSKLIYALLTGVRTANGEAVRAHQAHVLRSGQKNCWIEIVLDEGKNRQIRRMLEGLGGKVLRLVRVAIGPLQLGKLEKGSYRPLTAAEKLALDRAMAAGT